MTCTSAQFAAFRVTLGLFLVSQFLWLSPYAGEIYGLEGMYPPEIRTPFPSLLGYFTSDRQVEALLLVLAALSVVFAVGFHRRLAALFLWYGWACLTNRVPFLYIPSEGLVGWLLLLSVAVPSGEHWAIRPHPTPAWVMPRGFLFSAWLVLGVGYLASGIDKLSSPSWQQGTALRSVLMGPIGRWDGVAAVARGLPDAWVHALSWTVVAFELSFIALIWRPGTRLIAWSAASLFHLGVRATLNLHTVTDPFLIAQILTFDVAWLPRRSVEA